MKNGDILNEKWGHSSLLRDGKSGDGKGDLFPNPK
jgi:hypothetical protein